MSIEFEVPALGIRQSMNENPLVGPITVLLLAGIVVAIYVWRAHTVNVQNHSPQDFFSDDDGRSWFTDDAAKVAPFDHNGKTAVLARIFRCRNGQLFVGYLQKYSDESKERIDEAHGHPHPHAGSVHSNPGAVGGILIKKPLTGNWVLTTDPSSKEVTRFSGPDGTNDFAPANP